MAKMIPHCRRLGSAAAPPAWYNDAEAAFANAWTLMASMAPSSALRTPTVASVDLHGRPQQRTMVLRGVEFNGSTPTLRFHSDARSPKMEELRRAAAVSVLAYDKVEKLQLRMNGTASIRSLAAGDDTAVAAWQKSASFSRKCYFVADAPSSASSPDRMDDLQREMQAVATKDAGASESPHFAAIEIVIESCDLLYLAHGGNRRFLARYGDAAAPARVEWLVP